MAASGRNWTVANAGTTSNAVDVQSGLLVGVEIPAGAEGTTLTFEESVDDVTYSPVRVEAGTAYTLTIAATAALHRFANPYFFLGAKYLKIVLAAQTGAITIDPVYARPPS